MEGLYHSYGIQLIGMVFSIFFSSSIFILVRKKKIKEKYSLIWLFIALFVLTISLFEGLMEWFSNLIGIYYAPSAFFAILIGCAYLILLNCSITLSTLRTQNKSLIQEIALLRQRVEEVEFKNKKT